MRRFSVELCCTFLSTSLDPLGVEDCQTPMLQTCSMCNLKEGHRNFKEFCLNPKLLNDELMSDDSGSSDFHILTLLFSLAFTFFNCWLSKPSYETRWCKHQNGRALHRKFGYVAIPAVSCFLRRTAGLTPVAGSASEVLCHFWLYFGFSDTLRSLLLNRFRPLFSSTLGGDLVPSRQRERRAGIRFPLRDLCIAGALQPWEGHAKRSRGGLHHIPPGLESSWRLD